MNMDNRLAIVVVLRRQLKGCIIVLSWHERRCILLLEQTVTPPLLPQISPGLLDISVIEIDTDPFEIVIVPLISLEGCT